MTERRKAAQADPWALARKKLTPLQAMEQVWGEFFTPASDWAVWRVAIADAYGLPMTPADLKVWRGLSGRTVPPTTRALDVAWVMGRRAGKGRIAQLLAAHAAACVDWRPILGPGEHAVVSVMAQTRAKASDLRKGIEALLRSSRLTAGLIESVTDDEIILTTRVRIEVAAASFRSVRGGDSVVLFILDEVSSWYSAEQSANPDSEIVKATRPTTYTARASGLGGMMLFISSPLGKKGELWRMYKAGYGQDGARVRVLQASTFDMHPALRGLLDDEVAADPAAARSEVFGQFRDDIVAYMTEDLLARAVRAGWTGEAPRPGASYWGFVDPAGGSGGDSFVLGIARREGRRSVVVRLDEYRPPFSAVDAVAEMAETLKSYRGQFVTGDGFSGGTVADMFRKHGVHYRKERRTKSQVFHDALPLFTSGLAVLPDHRRMAAQFVALERTMMRGSNRETIGSPRGGWDDCANAAAGALLLAQRKPMMEGQGDAERARLSAGTPALDRFGAHEEVRELNGIRTIYRIFPATGQAIPDRVAAPEPEDLEHSFTPCAVCGGTHIKIGDEQAPCPQSEAWTPQQLMQRAVRPEAHPDVRLIETGYAANLARTAKTLGWTG